MRVNEKLRIVGKFNIETLSDQRFLGGSELSEIHTGELQDDRKNLEEIF